MQRLGRWKLVVLCFLAVLAVAPAASAKLKLEFDRPAARAGDQVLLTFGEYFVRPDHVVHVYFVRASILGRVVRPAAGGGTERPGPPPRLRGVVKIGTTRSGSAGLRFRVPRVAPGRYAAVVWCSTCTSSYLLAGLPGSVPDDASVRPTRSLLRILR